MDKKPNIFESARTILEGKTTLSESGGYIESMGPDFDKGVALLTAAWAKWKKGPMTEPEDIQPARRDVLDFIKSKLK